MLLLILGLFIDFVVHPVDVYLLEIRLHRDGSFDSPVLALRSRLDRLGDLHLRSDADVRHL